ncbi:ArsR family transcriptional regulator [Paucibacter sp. KCTC 42545]|uniref:ArsR family transcriptional regulator n=1 Tax=Paucibacter sp. KCTC 42545 TaxID=1768242 RepID=UPI0012E394F4|nr:ArsR family transcriptional regulator [Paucibacter sp. KCTC 42545]
MQPSGVFAGESGVLNMEVIAEIRRRHLVSKESISSIARDLNLSQPTVRKHLQTIEALGYVRQHQPAPKLGCFQATLESWLQTERHLPKAQRRTAKRLFEGLQSEGYRGAYDSVQRCVKQWKSAQLAPSIKGAFVPLVFVPGDACQFDWSQEQVDIDGVVQTVKVAHFRLAYSRQMFVVAYPRETQEMVLDTPHDLPPPAVPAMRKSRLKVT